LFGVLITLPNNFNPNHQGGLRSSESMWEGGVGTWTPPCACGNCMCIKIVNSDDKKTNEM
jgi:hypothetical protein